MYILQTTSDRQAHNSIQSRLLVIIVKLALKFKPCNDCRIRSVDAEAL